MTYDQLRKVTLSQTPTWEPDSGLNLDEGAFATTEFSPDGLVAELLSCFLGDYFLSYINSDTAISPPMWNLDDGVELDDGPLLTTGYNAGDSVALILNNFLGRCHYLYKSEGAFTSLPVDLTGMDEARTSAVEWAAITPEDTEVKVYFSLSKGNGENWGSWIQAANTETIPGIAEDLGLDGISLRYRVVLETTNVMVTPALQSIALTIGGVIYPEGSVRKGLDRLETFIDARDIEQTEDLQSRGLQKLVEIAPVTVFDTEILTHGPFKYMKDWDLGDIVTALNSVWGVSINSRITEVTEIYEPDGFQLRVTLGNSVPSLVDKIKQELDKPLFER